MCPLPLVLLHVLSLKPNVPLVYGLPVRKRRCLWVCESETCHAVSCLGLVIPSGLVSLLQSGEEPGKEGAKDAPRHDEKGAGQACFDIETAV